MGFLGSERPSQTPIFTDNYDSPIIINSLSCNQIRFVVRLLGPVKGVIYFWLRYHCFRKDGRRWRSVNIVVSRRPLVGIVLGRKRLHSAPSVPICRQSRCLRMVARFGKCCAPNASVHWLRRFEFFNLTGSSRVLIGMM